MCGPLIQSVVNIPGMVVNCCLALVSVGCHCWLLVVVCAVHTHAAFFCGGWYSGYVVGLNTTWNKNIFEWWAFDVVCTSSLSWPAQHDLEWNIWWIVGLNKGSSASYLNISSLQSWNVNRLGWELCIPTWVSCQLKMCSGMLLNWNYPTTQQNGKFWFYINNLQENCNKNLF